jgi:hypothetical protein
MLKRNIFGSLILLVFGALSIVSAQTEAVKPSLLMGDVASIDAGKIVLNTKDGAVTVSLSEKTEYKRVSAENPSLKAATPALFTDIGVGDKLVVTGILAPDKKSLPARSVFLMSKSDITAKHAKEAEEWKARGITGRVVSVDPQANRINIEVRGFAGGTSIALTPKPGAVLLRYAPDSIRFDEAKPGVIADIKPGDMLRALGERGADGTSFTAEKVVSGAFKTVGGTIKSIDTAKNELVITDLQTKKDVTVALGDASVLKRFPPEMAARMAAFQGGGVRPAGQGARPPQAAVTPGQPGANGQGRGGFGGGMRGGGGIDDMFERFPVISVADLKVGDMIAVSSTKTASTDRLTAIKLLAGIEPFVRAAQSSGSRANIRTGQGDFNIPGLEGFGTP